jgi:secreted trypsin-like serine protease
MINNSKQVLSKQLIYLSMIYSVFSFANPVNALEYQNNTTSIPLGEIASKEYNSSLGSVILESVNSKGDTIFSRCVASVTDSRWLTLAAHCVSSQTTKFKKGLFVLGNNVKQVYDIDLAVVPKDRSKLKNDGTDVGKNSTSVVNDYALIRTSTPMSNVASIPFCANDTSLPTGNYLANTLFFGANNVNYEPLETTSKPFLVGESVAYVTPNQTIIHTEFGNKDELVSLWNSKNNVVFNSPLESSIQKGDSGSPVLLKDKKCQIGVVSYIGNFHYQNPLTKQASQIPANFAATLQKEDVEWNKSARQSYTDNNEVVTLGILPNTIQVPVIEH